MPQSVQIQTLPPCPAIGVSGIIFNPQQQVLLIKRNQAPACGFWSIPGGKLEAGETLPAACQREIKEETGLDVVAKHIVAIVERRTEGFHYVVIDYLAELANPENYHAIAQSDVADAHWVELTNLDAYPLVDGLAEIIKRTWHASAHSRPAGLHDLDGKGTDYIVP